MCYRLRLKKQLGIWQIIAQADGSTLTEDINVWVVARIKKQVMKEAVHCYVDVMTASHVMGSWLVLHSFIHSVFQRSSKLDIELVIKIIIGTVKIEL